MRVSDIHAAIESLHPAAEFSVTLRGGGRWEISDWTDPSGAPAPAEADVQTALDAAPAALVAALCASIDTTAERARLRHITPGSAQSAVYTAKSAEAEAYIAAGRPSSGTGWPLLAAEAAATAQTKSQVADAVVTARDAWLAIAAQIEGERLGGKAAVVDAPDLAAAEAARDAACAALEAL